MNSILIGTTPSYLNRLNNLCTIPKRVTIPNTVTTIGIGAFDTCTSLKAIDIPDSVVSIKLFAFIDCTSLKTITIPKSVIEIDDDAFNGCTALKTIRGSQGSYAQKWAEEHGYTFVDLED